MFRPNRHIPDLFTALRCCCGLLLLWGLAAGVSVCKAQLSGVRDTRASEFGAISGFLVQGDGRPVVGATVIVVRSGRECQTGRDGSFVLRDVPPGTHALLATQTGFQPTRILDVVVHPSSSVTLAKVTMRPSLDGIMDMEPYIVRGEAVSRDSLGPDGAPERIYSRSEVTQPPQPVHTEGPELSRTLLPSLRNLSPLFHLIVERDGKVGDIRVVKSSGNDTVDEQCTAALRAWRFIPATSNGRKVRCAVQQEFQFPPEIASPFQAY